VNDVKTFLFGILFGAVAIGFFLIHRVYEILEKRHPEKYEAMGSPSLIMNNSISNNISFMKFIFKLEWKDLGDPSLSNLSRFLLVYFVVYSVGLLCLIFAVPLGLAT
jgi:hypothetical protein